jgi:hypothetical protein
MHHAWDGLLALCDTGALIGLIPPSHVPECMRRERAELHLHYTSASSLIQGDDTLARGEERLSISHARRNYFKEQRCALVA